MDWKKGEFWLALVLVIYLLVIGVGAAAIVTINLPMDCRDQTTSTDDNEGQTDSGGEATPADDDKGEVEFFPLGTLRSPDQGLALLALFAGIAGSFIHAAQSLSSYIGNKTFKVSWTAWYFLRPWIGGVLGIALYFAIRAGIVSGTTTVNPYVVVAFGLLGGWFSKTTTDKLQEVFGTLFKTEQDEQRRDKLAMPKRPSIKDIDPSPVPAGANEIVIVGEDFMKGAAVRIDDNELPADFVSQGTLRVSLARLPQRPAAGTDVYIRVKNPEGIEPLSKAHKLTFQ
jgi:hypothetical protein